jgi:hypothetical protein
VSIIHNYSSFDRYCQKQPNAEHSKCTYTVSASFLHQFLTPASYTTHKSNETNKGDVEVSKVKLNYLLDAVIGLAFLLSSATGIAFLLMGSGGYQGGRNPNFATALLGLSRETWSDLHTWASLVMIAGVTVHLVFHWKWIICATQKMLPSLPYRVNQAEEQVCEVIM